MLKEWNEYLEAVHKNKFESDNIRMPMKLLIFSCLVVNSPSEGPRNTRNTKFAVWV